MKNKEEFYMDDMRDIAVDVSELIETKLKEFDIVLTPEQEDAIHNKVWEVLEPLTNSYYRNYN